MSADAAQLNAKLIERISRNMKCGGDSLPDHVAAAFRAVPRHPFVPDSPLEQAYADVAIVLKDERGEPRSSSSQPTVVALMLTQLELRAGHRVLEIGAGSGYNAALMASIVGDSGRVVTIDLDEEIATAARGKLATAGVGSVEVVVGDGAGGWPATAPFDRIIVTAAAWDVPSAWRAQLVDDGRIVMPLILHGGQACVAFRPVGDVLESTSIRQCGFMPLRGSSGRLGPAIALGPREGLFVEFAARGDPPVAAEVVYGWLTGRWTEEPTGVLIDSPGQVFEAYGWIALRDPGYCRVWAYGDDAEHELLPQLPLPGTSGRGSNAAGLADDRGLAVLALPDPRFDEASRLFVRRYGDADSAARRLIEQLESWDARGRPDPLPQRIRVLPKGTPSAAGADVLVRRESVVLVE